MRAERSRLLIGLSVAVLLACGPPAGQSIAVSSSGSVVYFDDYRDHPPRSEPVKVVASFGASGPRMSPANSTPGMAGARIRPEAAA